MYTSFYTAAAGAAAQQARMDVTANNLANVNTAGFKPKNAVFSQLMYYNMNGSKKVSAGSGAHVEKTDTIFSDNGFEETNGAYDFAIIGDGFFRLADPEDNRIYYSRNGHFSLSEQGGTMYLVNDEGHRVLDAAGAPITVAGENLSAEPSVWGFAFQNGMESVGNNEFVPTQKNGNPYLNTGAQLKQGALEPSGTDMIDEMTRIIECQRAYSYSLKMIQTSDEVMNTINTLRQ